MKGRYLLGSNEGIVEPNIYADKSVVVLDWLLRVGILKESFSLRELVRDQNVSLGLAQRVLKTLVMEGVLRTEGVRTAKKFMFKDPKRLLKNWLKNYSVVKKCRHWTYESPFQSQEELIKALKKSGLSQKVVLALHTAANAYGCKNTNLQTIELYMIKPNIRKTLEKKLHLRPQEKGYSVLLIEPYYKSLLRSTAHVYQGVKVSSPLLAFLDLYHFPLRGLEQAEFLADRIPELKQVLSYDAG